MAPLRSRSNASLLLDQGVVRYALGKRDAAIKLWQEALAEEPDNDRARDYLRSVGAIPSAGQDDLGINTDEVPTVAEPEDFVPEVDNSRAGDSLVPPFAAEVTAYDDGDSDELEIESMVPDVEIMLRDAVEGEAAGRLEEALKHAEEALKRDPEHPEAIRLALSLRSRLSADYLEELQPLERVPVLRATDASILELSLDPIGGFLISQIDGEITIEDLLTILGTFDQFRVLSALHFFLENGIIELR